MTVERWGSLSVNDHIDTAALAANVLLYDRLVLPIMSTQTDRDERAYWLAHGWDPDLQRKRLDQLEELAVCRPWDSARRAHFKNRLAELQAEKFDAQHIDSYAMTRAILAQEQVVQKPQGVHHVDVIASYNSGAALAEDFLLEDSKSHVTAQAANELDHPLRLETAVLRRAGGVSPLRVGAVDVIAEVHAAHARRFHVSDQRVELT